MFVVWKVSVYDEFCQMILKYGNKTAQHFHLIFRIIER